MQIELHVEGSGPLLDAISNARIDLAVIIGQENHAGAQTVGRLDLVWISSSTFNPPPEQPLPLAMLGQQCIFRRSAVQRLEEAGVPYRIAANSPSLNGLWAALLGGLGVTVRTALSLPDGLVSARSLHGLPPIGSLPVTVHRNANSKGASADRMASLLTQALELVLQPKPKTKAAGRVRKA